MDNPILTVAMPGMGRHMSALPKSRTPLIKISPKCAAWERMHAMHLLRDMHRQPDLRYFMKSVTHT
jgi:hypothetical protein